MPNQDIPLHIAFFVTPHGYGHAARSSAVMKAIRDLVPDVVFEIYTRTPVWFFNMTLQHGFNYHPLLTDIGIVQTTAMNEDLPGTIQQLEQMLPFRMQVIEELAHEVRAAGCKLVLCDIAPLGIAVAHAAGLPSILEENFTWDWIYAGYLAQEPRFSPFIHYLREAFSAADIHIRTLPACAEHLPADLVTNVVARKPRTPAYTTRQQLNLAQETPMVMITMGGIVTEYPFLDRLVNAKEVNFLVPGGSDHYEQRGSLVLIPHHSNFYHPDLVAASNAIIGKLGYSTLAEAYFAGLPFAYVPRERFRESGPMGRYAQEAMGAIELPEEDFFNGAWLNLLPRLLTQPRYKPNGPNGADQIAEYLQNKKLLA